MANTTTKLSTVDKTSSSDISSANMLCVSNGHVKQLPGYIQQIDKNKNDIASMMLRVYPIGSIYISVNTTNPGTLFGGTWEQIKDRFILAAGGSYTVGSTGGEATHTLSVNEMPSHSHGASSGSAGNHNHYIDAKGTDDEVKNYGLQYGGGFGGRCLVSGGNYWSSTNGAHSHSVNVNSTGGSAAHNNMPPYLAVYMWKRTA